MSFKNPWQFFSLQPEGICRFPRKCLYLEKVPVFLQEAGNAPVLQKAWQREDHSSGVPGQGETLQLRILLWFVAVASVGELVQPRIRGQSLADLALRQWKGTLCFRCVTVARKEQNKCQGITKETPASWLDSCVLAQPVSTGFPLLFLVV